jgi:hypothetical protein
MSFLEGLFGASHLAAKRQREKEEAAPKSEPPIPSNSNLGFFLGLFQSKRAAPLNPKPNFLIRLFQPNRVASPNPKPNFLTRLFQPRQK